MVRITTIALLMFLTPLSHASSRYLQLNVNDTEVELGKPLQIVIAAHNISKNLTVIDTDALLKDFGVYVIESSTKSTEDKNKIQELKISLYPHRSGKVEIPSLELGGYSSKPRTVTILPAIEDTKALNFSTVTSSLSAWQRQQVVVTTSVVTHSKFAKIILDDFSYKGIESYKLETSRTALDNGRFRLTSSWILYPFISGTHNINFPAVNYRLKGKVQRKFIPQNIRLNVKSLPPYIPPLMPVGKITIDKRIIKNNNEINNKHILAVTISSAQVLPSTLPSLPRDYIVDKDIIAAKTISTLTTNLKDNNFISSIQHRIPISFNTSGSYKFPELIYKYFEPNTGKIITVKDGSQNTLILSLWLKLVLIISLGIILAKSLQAAIRYIRTILKLRNRRIMITNSILDAQSPQELHCLLNEYAKTYHLGGNMTPEGLRVIWGNNRKISPEDGLNDLSRACYTRDWDINALPELNKKIYLLLT